MKLVLFVSTVAIFISNTSYAYVNQSCAKRVAEECYAQEKDKPDSERSGTTAAEYCAAAAVVECDR
jgi:hypothetical protein